MQTNNSVFTPQAKDTIHKGHIHFFDYVDSFHGMDNLPEYGTSQQTIVDKLRHQYLHENNWEDNLCMRNCFKLKEQRYVEFCLDKKCGGISLQRAAQQLGYTKTGISKPKSEGHH